MWTEMIFLLPISLLIVFPGIFISFLEIATINAFIPLINNFNNNFNNKGRLVITYVPKEETYQEQDDDEEEDADDEKVDNVEEEADNVEEEADDEITQVTKIEEEKPKCTIEGDCECFQNKNTSFYVENKLD
jgi:hypothetical protein